MIRYRMNPFTNLAWDITPMADDTYSLGSGTKRFKKAWTEDLDNANDLTNGGDINSTGNIESDGNLVATSGSVYGLTIQPIKQLMLPLNYERLDFLPEIYMIEGAPDRVFVVDTENNETELATV